MSFFSRKKGATTKPKPPDRSIRFSRKTATKTASLLFFTVIGLSLLFNVIFFSKYQTIRNDVQAQQTSIENRLQDVPVTDRLASHAAVVYTEDFLRMYFNLPEETEARNERMKKLQQYFVSGFDLMRLGDDENFKGSRELTDLTYIETVRTSEATADIHFAADYNIHEVSVNQNGEEKEKQTEEEQESKTVQHGVEIVVPITTDGKGYAVTGNPRLTERALQADVPMKDKLLDGEEASTTDREQIRAFLEDFFTSYGISDEKLPFMAAVNRGLSNQVFEGLSIRELVEDKGGYRGLVDVTYRHKETSLSAIYTYQLVLTKENRQYFITSME